MLILEGEAGKQIPESSRLEFQMQKIASKDHLASLCFLSINNLPKVVRA